MGKARKGEEFNQIELISSPNGSSLKLGDLATVKDAFEDKALYTTFSDQPAVTLRVFRVGNQSPLDISEKVNAYVKETTSKLPEGVSMTIWQDSSYYLQGRLQMMIRNAFQGLLLVFWFSLCFCDHPWPYGSLSGCPFPSWEPLPQWG